MTVMPTVMVDGRNFGKQENNKYSYQNCVAPYLIMWFNLPVTLLK